MQQAHNTLTALRPWRPEHPDPYPVVPVYKGTYTKLSGREPYPSRLKGIRPGRNSQTCRGAYGRCIDPPTRPSPHVQVGLLEIVGQGTSELDDQLPQGRLAAGLGVQPVEAAQSLCRSLLAQLLEQRPEVRVVTGGVALQDEHSLDPQHQDASRHRDRLSPPLHGLGFQRLDADELPHSRQDPVEAAQGNAVTRVQNSGAAACEHGIEDNRLQVRGGEEDVLPIRKSRG